MLAAFMAVQSVKAGPVSHAIVAAHFIVAAHSRQRSTIHVRDARMLPFRRNRRGFDDMRRRPAARIDERIER